MHCRPTLRSRGLAWLPPLWPYQDATASHPPAGWVTLAEVSDFVLSFPWVWIGSVLHGSPPHQPPAPSVSLYGYENE